MAWKDVLVPLFRVGLDDLTAASETYTDLILVKKLILATKQLIKLATFRANYTLAIDTGDGTDWDISPDPLISLGGTEDYDFTNLLLLKALCNHITQGSLAGARRAIKVKDGSTSVDTSVGSSSHRDLLERGPCQEFFVSLQQYLSGSGDYRILSNFATDRKYKPHKQSSIGRIDRTQ